MERNVRPHLAIEPVVFVGPVTEREHIDGITSDFFKHPFEIANIAEWGDMDAHRAFRVLFRNYRGAAQINIRMKRELPEAWDNVSSIIYRQYPNPSMLQTASRTSGIGDGLRKTRMWQATAQYVSGHGNNIKRRLIYSVDDGVLGAIPEQQWTNEDRRRLEELKQNFPAVIRETFH